MIINYKIEEIRKIRHHLRKANKAVGFVPTMGYLHEGHLSLIKKAKETCDAVFVSIFVNPTQFGPNEDFEKYPRDIERDANLAKEAGADYLFIPATKEVYPGNFNTKLAIGNVTDKYEGYKRPGHFDGVALVVAKLFNIIEPNKAFFGRKDYQQCLVIQKLVEDLNFNLKIEIEPTVREDDGLAKSSRNTYLSKEERAAAPIIYQSLKAAEEAILKGERNGSAIDAILYEKLRSDIIMIDYAESALADSLEKPETYLPGQRIVLLIAAYLGKTRLIDNLLVDIKEN